jgi:hypothetical protein
MWMSCTVSDEEVFALLLLENWYNRWKDIFQQKKTKHPPMPQQEARSASKSGNQSQMFAPST